MIYFIRHITRYRYSAPIRESIMEARMQPRSDGNQHCIEFRLDVTPKAKPTCYHDHLENAVHHFDIPGEHDQIFLLAESTVEVKPLLPLPEFLPHIVWREIDALVNDGIFWDLLQPSAFVQTSPLVDDLAAELQVDRRDDPLTTLLRLNRSLYEVFSYVPQSTKVDSSIDVAIAHRRGVFKGLAASELAVSVSVTPSPIPITPEGQVLLSTLTAPAPRPSRRIDQQQQQQ